MQINICQDSQGNVWSDHDFATPEHEDYARGLQNGGVFQIAHALITEAVRREAFTTLIVILSKNPALLKQWSQETPEGRKVLEGMIANQASLTLRATMEKMIPGAVAGVLDMLISNEEGSNSPPME